MDGALTAVKLPINALQVVGEPRRVSLKAAQSLFVGRAAGDVVQREGAIVQDPAHEAVGPPGPRSKVPMRGAGEDLRVQVGGEGGRGGGDVGEVGGDVVVWEGGRLGQGRESKRDDDGRDDCEQRGWRPLTVSRLADIQGRGKAGTNRYRASRQRRGSDPAGSTAPNAVSSSSSS